MQKEIIHTHIQLAEHQGFNMHEAAICSQILDLSGSLLSTLTSNGPPGFQVGVFPNIYSLTCLKMLGTEPGTSACKHNVLTLSQSLLGVGGFGFSNYFQMYETKSIDHIIWESHEKGRGSNRD